jgi:PAS domain S-box-containing protein
LDNYPLTVVVGLADGQVYSPVNSRRNGSILLGAVVSILLLAGTRLILSFDRQQRQVEDDLREANKRLGMATASGHLGIWEWDVLTGSLVWDARMLEMYGIKPESFSGHTRDFQKALHPDDLARTNRALKAAITGEKDFSTIEFRIVHSDGAVKIITANGQVIRDPSGRAVRMIGLNRDITDHMTAVNELRESEHRFKTLADATFEGIVISAQGRYVDVNKRLTQILGFEKSELIGREMPAIPVPEERTDASGSRCEDYVEHEMVCKDGSRRFVEARSQTIVGKGREFSITTIRDITERKQMEEALRDSEDQFRSLCDAAPIGIFKLDREGNNVYGNPRWEEITGYSASQGMNMGWLLGIHPDDTENVSKMLLDAASAGRGFSHEHRHLTPCGETVWVRKLVNSVMNSEGTVLSYVGTLEDITELLKVRHEMQKVQKLESLGVLAGGIAHDFNNFLTAILGNVSLARSQSGDPERLNRRLEFVENATLRATGLTKQLLTFARGGDPVKRIINLNDLLREAVPFALHGSNVASNIDLAEDICLVEADEGQFAQVIHNLMINAVQAMPKGGTVTVRSEKTRARHKGEFVRISFADTGTGISEENLERIFDPYFTTKDHGSGLGLATCYSIIKKHGGKIRATSAVGEGSTFIISLPASAHVCVSESISVTTLFHGNGRVLVMDDDEDIRDIAHEMLEELGYIVELAANAADAVNLYRKRKEQGTPFSATILDLTIQGGIGGKETIEKLLEIDPCVKAVVSSGYSNDPIMANYRDYGFRAVLSKPYLPLEMCKVLRELIAL